LTRARLSFAHFLRGNSPGALRGRLPPPGRDGEPDQRAADVPIRRSHVGAAHGGRPDAPVALLGGLPDAQRAAASRSHRHLLRPGPLLMPTLASRGVRSALSTVMSSYDELSRLDPFWTPLVLDLRSPEPGNSSFETLETVRAPLASRTVQPPGPDSGSATSRCRSCPRAHGNVA